MATTKVKLILGGGMFISEAGYNPTKVGEVLDYLETHGIKNIDSAEIYGDSEQLIGLAHAPSRGFVIDTKVAGGVSPNVSTKENVIKAVEGSLKRINADDVPGFQLDVYFIHTPDQRVALKDTLEGINEAYKAGKFKRFGLSNFAAEGVEEVYRTAQENNFVLPSVYQGNYNAVSRRTETELFPILRKYNMSFYAYSPIGGGFLTKTVEDIDNQKGRFNKNQRFGDMYTSLYRRPLLLEFLVGFGNLAEEEGISKADLAYRWIAYHSELKAELGDGIIIGSRFGPQLTGTLEALEKGPLSEKAVVKLDELWKAAEKDSVLDNWNDFLAANVKH